MVDLRIAGAALNQTPLDWSNNLNNIKDAIDKAIDAKVDLLCLPELTITGYGCEDNFLSQWIYDKSLECLQQIRPWCKGISVAVGLPIRVKGIAYNATCIIENAEFKCIYVKQNMALDGVHYEPRWFTPWEIDRQEQIQIGDFTCHIGDLIYNLKGVKIGFEICEDAWRKGRPACRLHKKGIDLIINPSASHFAMGKTLEREELVVSSSKNFDCAYLYANLLGNEAGRMVYDGEILIAQKGHLLAKNDWLSFKNVDLVYADVDFAQSFKKSTPQDYSRDKNIEFAKASSLALFDYLRKSKSKGFVLSLSGGADSSSIAVLVAEMVRRGIKELGVSQFIEKIGLKETLREALDLPEDKVDKFIVAKILHCAYQGTVNSSDDTFNSAKALCEDIGATFSHWLIDEEVKSYTEKMETVLGRSLTWEQDDIALQNIQARARSPIIWMLANINNALLLTTSNRSEGDVGYTTMDGDTSGSIAPIAAVDKHFIINWLKWAETDLGYQSLKHVNSLQPSAELRPLSSTQTDETDLMPYSILVKIEREAIKHHKSPVEVFRKLSSEGLEPDDLLKKHITKFFQLWSRNQWKRERIAPAFHLDDFNVDPRTWCRFPILSSGFKEELAELNSNT
ncbi:NAD(+) synthase [Fulvivirga sp. RKSG066]|uniref:NAD(+) synthase n=1 Tax=Fulvivirga aurantia TaxID=2529383 RepID=UPI00162665FE|nr:NAD(+) synthase [Fulvivirga aurantia]